MKNYLYLLKMNLVCLAASFCSLLAYPETFHRFMKNGTTIDLIGDRHKTCFDITAIEKYWMIIFNNVGQDGEFVSVLWEWQLPPDSFMEKVTSFFAHNIVGSNDLFDTGSYFLSSNAHFMNVENRSNLYISTFYNLRYNFELLFSETEFIGAHLPEWFDAASHECFFTQEELEKEAENILLLLSKKRDRVPTIYRSEYDALLRDVFTESRESFNLLPTSSVCLCQKLLSFFKDNGKEQFLMLINKIFEPYIWITLDLHTLAVILSDQATHKIIYLGSHHTKNIADYLENFFDHTLVYKTSKSVDSDREGPLSKEVANMLLQHQSTKPCIIEESSLKSLNPMQYWFWKYRRYFFTPFGIFINTKVTTL